MTLPVFIGNVYIADTTNSRIRKVTVSTGIITTVAGTGVPSYNGDGGQATSARVFYPYGVTLDASGKRIQMFAFYFVPFLPFLPFLSL